MAPLSEREMSDFKHSLSYYKDIVERAKTNVRRVSIPPRSTSRALSVEPLDQKSRQAIAERAQQVHPVDSMRTRVQAAAKTKARVQVIIRDHDAVLRALKNR